MLLVLSRLGVLIHSTHNFRLIMTTDVAQEAICVLCCLLKKYIYDV